MRENSRYGREGLSKDVVCFVFLRKFLLLLFIYLFFNFWATPHARQGLSSLSRDITHGPCSMDSYPLDCQGSPNNVVFKLK